MLKHPGSIPLEDQAKTLEGEKQAARSALEQVEGPAAELLRTEVSFIDKPMARPESRVANAIESLKESLRGQIDERFDGKIRGLKEEKERLEASVPKF